MNSPSVEAIQLCDSYLIQLDSKKLGLNTGFSNIKTICIIHTAAQNSEFSKKLIDDYFPTSLFILQNFSPNNLHLINFDKIFIDRDSIWFRIIRQTIRAEVQKITQRHPKEIFKILILTDIDRDEDNLVLEVLTDQQSFTPSIRNIDLLKFVPDKLTITELFFPDVKYTPSVVPTNFRLVHKLRKPSELSEIIAQMIDSGIYQPKTYIEADSPILFNSKKCTFVSKHKIRNLEKKLIWAESLPKFLKINNKIIKINKISKNYLINVLIKTKKYFESIIRPMELFSFRSFSSKPIKTLSKFNKKTLTFLQKFLNSKTFKKTEISSSLLNKTIETCRNSLNVLNNLEGIINQKQLAHHQNRPYLNKNLIDDAMSLRSASVFTKNGSNLTEIALKEIINLYKNKKELDQINCKNETKSFYGFTTTEESLREIFEQIESNSLNVHNLEATDILEMLHFVGVGCLADVKEFSKPNSWKMTKIFPESNLSNSDIMHALSQIPNYDPNFSVGEGILSVNSRENITCVIPLFANENLQKFFLKHAYNLLQYNASFGMRRVIANVSLTYEYSLCLGVLKLSKVLSKRKLENDVKCFLLFLKNFWVGCKDKFNHLINTVNSYTGSEMLSGLDKEGITDLIIVIYKLIKERDNKKLVKLLRTIYVNEVYRVVKKGGFRNKEEYIGECKKLLCFNYDVYLNNNKKLLKESLFIVPGYFKEVYKSLSRKWKSVFKVVRHIGLMVKCMKISLEKNPVEGILKLRESNEELERAELGVEDLEEYKAMVLLQCLINSSPRDRMEINKGKGKREKKSKLKDVGKKENGEEMVKEFVVWENGRVIKNEEKKKGAKDTFYEVLKVIGKQAMENGNK